MGYDYFFELPLFPAYVTVTTRGNEMTEHTALMSELDGLPSEFLGEVTDFIAWLKHRKIQQQLLKIPETMTLSETVLAKEWNTPEEEKAWASL
jgi:hypothetical protein